MTTVTDQSTLQHTWRLCLLFFTLATPAVNAQQVAREDAGALVHYAYAPLLGTGLYTIGDQSAYVFRIPAGYQWRKANLEEPGIYMHLPVSIGLYNFDFRDIPETGTEDIATVSFVPGIEMQYLMQENWLLKPFGNFGWGSDFANDDSALIYALGLKSLTDFQLERMTLSLGVEYLWSGYKPDKGNSDYITRVGLGLNTSYPLDWQIGNGQAKFIMHAIAYYYVNEIQFPSTRGLQETFDVRQEYEIGIALGRDPGISILGIEFDQFGIGYRFGGSLDAIVLTGSFPF